MNRLFLLAIPLVLLLVVSATHNAFAWDFGPLFGGFHHWGLDGCGTYCQGEGSNNNGQFGCGPYCQGERDAQYDHTQGLIYNPYPRCCHSEYYQQAFHQGYDQQWNTYQSQEQQTDQRSNIYINNSPGAYVSTTQNSNQDQSQNQEPSWTSPDNTNGDCSNGCPWGQGP